MKLTTKLGSVVYYEGDAIVNSANIGLKAGSGLCGAVHDAAGPDLEKECNKIGSCQRGEAVITRGYNLPAKYIIHTVGPVYGQHDGKEAEILYSCYYESLRLAEKHGIRSIAFPEISTGIYSYPAVEAAKVANQAITDYFEDNMDSKIEEVCLVKYDGPKVR